jgi:hypothetical protein
LRGEDINNEIEVTEAIKTADSVQLRHDTLVKPRTIGHEPSDHDCESRDDEIIEVPTEPRKRRRPSINRGKL